MGSPEPLVAFPCRGDWLCQAGQSCPPARGTLLRGVGGFGEPEGRAGSAHGGVCTAGVGMGGRAMERMPGWVCTSGCLHAAVHAGGAGSAAHTHQHGSPCVSVHTRLCECAQTWGPLLGFGGTGTDQLSSHPWGSGTACRQCRHKPPGWKWCWAGAQLCAWQRFCRAPACQQSGEQGPVALKGAGRAPGRDGNESPGVCAAQRHLLG